jgi:winged helix DNA-binding protein
MNHEIARRRLFNQGLARKAHRRPEEVVAWQGAMQAQEYPAARWGLAVRMENGATDREIERAVDEGRILRTHVMRPTWHFVTPGDIRWMLDLTAPRVRQRMAIYARNTGLDATTVSKSLGVFERAVGDGQHLIRAELGARLARAGISAKGIRLALLTMFAELEALICSGPYRAKQLTYASLAERAPNARVLQRDEALAELTLRYFRSHGPATIRDFVWWSGLTTADARRGLDMIRAKHEVVEGLKYSSVEREPRAASRRRTIYMLPVYDEYLVAYRDREAVPHVWMRPSGKKPVSFKHAIVANGQMAASWRTSQSAAGVVVEVALLRRFSRSEHRSLSERAVEYGGFLRQPISLSIC